MSLYVTTMVFNTVLVFCQFNTMGAALPSRFSRKRTFLMINGVSLCLLIACGLSMLVLEPDKVIYFFSMACWVPQMVTALFISRRWGGQFWCIFFACDVASVISSTGAYVVGTWFFPFDSPNWGMVLLRSIGVLLGTAFAVGFLIPRFKSLLDVPGVPWWPLAAAVFLMEMMILFMVLCPRLIFYRPWEHINLLAVCVASGVVLSLLVVSLNRVKEAAHRTKELEKQLIMSEGYYAQLTAQLQENCIRLHDLRHHLDVLYTLCSQGQQEELKSYLCLVKEALPSGTGKEYCASGAVNALLDHYDGLCRDAKILFDCQVRLPHLARIAPLHLCVIFGNALQNALEAMAELPEGTERTLQVQAVRAEGRLVITVTNPVAGQVSLGRNGLPVTKKREPGHGFGLLSIRETVRQYDGWMDVEQQGQVFTLRVVLKDEET